MGLGVYKNVENMTDREMIEEYDKLKKQSRKMQKRLRRQKAAKDARLSTASNESDISYDHSKSIEEKLNSKN